MKYKLCIIYSIFCFSVLTTATPSIKIINTSKTPIAFVLVPTDRGSRHKHLYIRADAKLDVQAPVKQNIKVFFLHPKEDVTIPNLRQNIMAYDRTLWVVALPEAGAQISTPIQELGASVYQGTLRPGVKPFEVGSAKIAEISGTKDALRMNTTGKLSQGAKALVGLAKNDASASSDNQALVGHGLDELLSGATTNAIRGRMETRIRSGGPSSVTKKSVPKTVTSAKGDPVGWPTVVDGKKMSFQQVVTILRLTQDQVSKLKNYHTLGHDDRHELNDSVLNIVRLNQSTETKNAYGFVKKYTNNFIEKSGY